MNESRRENWDTFWRAKEKVEEVYSNAGRLPDHLSAVLDVRGKRILEIGAGTGRDSFPLVGRGAHVFQLDYSEPSLQILKKLSQEQRLSVRILGGDTFALPFKDESFDVVFHQGLLEHFRVPKAEALLKENLRILKKGGLLLVDVPQRFHLYTVAKHILMFFGKWFAGWERSFTVGELRLVLVRLGIKPIYSYGEWMYPSFIYRASREVLKKFGLILPLYPKVPGLSRLRSSARSALLKTSLPLFTGISIGVIARK